MSSGRCRPLPGEPSYLGIAVEYHRAAGRRISNASFAPAGVQLPGRLSPCALAIDFGNPLIGGHRARGLEMHMVGHHLAHADEIERAGGQAELGDLRSEEHTSEL